MDEPQLKSWGNQFGLTKTSTEGNYQFAKRIKTTIECKVLFNGLERAKIIASDYRRNKNREYRQENKKGGTFSEEKGVQAKTQEN